jgi:hypothetical protein
LRTSVAECSGNCPADSAPTFTGINSVKGLIGGSGTNAILGAIFPSWFTTAHHDFPAIKSSFMRAAFIGISIHDFHSCA